MAAAWFGCQVSMDEATGEQEQAAMTPGGQTPVPLPNDAGLGYYEYLPAGYGTGTRFPLIVSLHGICERGDGSPGQLALVLNAGVPKLIESGKEFPAIVISPQLKGTGCPNPPFHPRWEASVTTSFVSYLLNHYDVDPDRIYITGLSLGGEGTLRYGRANPGLPAAIVPICGPKFGTGYDVLHDMPLWVFHREGDPEVSINESVSLLEEVTGVRPPVIPGSTAYFDGVRWITRPGQAAPAAGENPAFTVYAGDYHNAWTAAYGNNAMWNWLFAQRRGIFQQDFQSSTSVSDYENATNPDNGQFNDIGGQPNSGTFSINQGRLQLVRTGSTATDNDAAITRWTDLAGPPAVLHAAFDVGVSGWTTTPSQSGAMILTVGRMDGMISYSSGGAAISHFHNISVKGQGVGQFSISMSGVESALLAANGTLHHVDVFLNKSGAAVNYRAPDGSLRSLQNNGVALWVNKAPVVVNAAALNGAESTLTDFRFRWPSADNGTWVLDNIVFKRTLPQ